MDLLEIVSKQTESSYKKSLEIDSTTQSFLDRLAITETPEERLRQSLATSLPELDAWKRKLQNHDKNRVLKLQLLKGLEKHWRQCPPKNNRIIFRRCCTLLFGAFMKAGLLDVFFPTSEVVSKMLDLLLLLFEQTEPSLRKTFLINIKTDKLDKKLAKLIKMRLTDMPKSLFVKSDVKLVERLNIKISDGILERTPWFVPRKLDFQSLPSELSQPSSYHLQEIYGAEAAERRYQRELKKQAYKHYPLRRSSNASHKARPSKGLYTQSLELPSIDRSWDALDQKPSIFAGTLDREGSVSELSSLPPFPVTSSVISSVCQDKKTSLVERSDRDLSMYLDCPASLSELNQQSELFSKPTGNKQARIRQQKVCQRLHAASRNYSTKPQKRRKSSREVRSACKILSGKKKREKKKSSPSQQPGLQSQSRQVKFKLREKFANTPPHNGKSFASHVDDTIHRLCQMLSTDIKYGRCNRKQMAGEGRREEIYEKESKECAYLQNDQTSSVQHLRFSSSPETPTATRVHEDRKENVHDDNSETVLDEKSMIPSDHFSEVVQDSIQNKFQSIRSTGKAHIDDVAKTTTTKPSEEPKYEIATTESQQNEPHHDSGLEQTHSQREDALVFPFTLEQETAEAEVLPTAIEELCITKEMHCDTLFPKTTARSRPQTAETQRFSLLEGTSSKSSAFRPVTAGQFEPRNGRKKFR